VGSINKYVGAWTDLSDTPAGLPSAFDFVRSDAGGTALEGFDLFGTVNEFTAFNAFSGGLSFADGGGSLVTNDNSITGGFANNTGTIETGAAGCVAIGRVTGSSGSTAKIRSLASACLLFGRVDTDGSGASAEMVSNLGADGSFIGGYCKAEAGASALMSAYSYYGGGANLVWGSCTSQNGSASMYAFDGGNLIFGTTYGTGDLQLTSSYGGFARGNVIGTGATSRIMRVRANGVASTANGFVWNQTATSNAAEIDSSGWGSQASGMSESNASGASLIETTGRGSLASGHAIASEIRATGEAAIAFGYATGTNDVVASGDSSFAFGASAANPITASATNAVQFGPGTNNSADSLQVGGGFQAWGISGNVRVDGDIDHNGSNVGFFSAAPVAQQTDPGALVDNSGGGVDGTIAAVAGTGDDATINNNLADLADRINTIRDALSAAASGVGITA